MWSDSRVRLSSENALLGVVVALGGLLRLAFLLWGATALYGAGNEFTFGDSESYMGFRHLIEHGTYTFDPTHPDAKFGRVPGYPLFWGLHYVIFGAFTAKAVAFSQVILDTVSVFLTFRIGRLLHSSGAGILAALGYALWPFAIMWTTITGTEVLATFLTLLFVERMFSLEGMPRLRTVVLLGCLAGFSLLTREYLGLLLIAGMGYLLTRFRSWKLPLLLFVGFLVAYLPWPARNYLIHDRLVLARPPNAGYHRYEADVYAVIRWYVATHDVGTTGRIDETLADVATGRLDREVGGFPDDASYQRATALVAKAPTCGRGFYYWKHGVPMPSGTEECTAEIVSGFDEIAAKAKRDNWVLPYVKGPLSVLKKAVFKNELTSGETPLHVRAAFFGRSVMVLLGLLGLFFVGTRAQRLTIVLFVVPLHLFWMYVVGFVEMRYLLQSDALFFCVGAAVVAHIFRAFGLSNFANKFVHSRTSTNESS